MTDSQKKKSVHIYDKLEAHGRLSLDNDGRIEIDNTPTGVLMSSFLYDVQQPFKKLDSGFEIVLRELFVPELGMANKIAKAIAQDGWEKFESPNAKATRKRKGSRR